jgi:hypothetical protein
VHFKDGAEVRDPFRLLQHSDPPGSFRSVTSLIIAAFHPDETGGNAP